MTNREAALKSCKDRLEHLENAPSHHCGKRQRQRAIELEKVKIEALRPVSREQVEKVWRGEWEWFDETVGTPIDGYEREWGWRCSKCKTVLPDEFDNPDDSPAMRFCQWCGAPMTAEAVQMVMERMEKLHEDNGCP